MARLGEFLPDIVNRDAQLIQSNKMLSEMYNNGFMNSVKANYVHEKSAVQQFGIEQLYLDWL